MTKFLIIMLLSLPLFSKEIKSVNPPIDKWKIYASILSMDSDKKVHIELREGPNFRLKLIHGKKENYITHDSHRRVDTSRTRFVRISNYKNELLVVVRESGQFETIDLYDTDTLERLTTLYSYGQIQYDANNQNLYFKINKENIDPETEERSYRVKDLRWPQSVKNNKKPTEKQKAKAK